MIFFLFHAVLIRLSLYDKMMQVTIPQVLDFFGFYAFLSYSTLANEVCA